MDRRGGGEALQKNIERLCRKQCVERTNVSEEPEKKKQMSMERGGALRTNGRLVSSIECRKVCGISVRLGELQTESELGPGTI